MLYLPFCRSRKDSHAPGELYCQPGSGRDSGNGDAYPGKAVYDDWGSRNRENHRCRMLAQILGLPYYVFTCGPGTDELELLASTVPNMGTKKKTLPVLPAFYDLQMDPASALCVLSGTYEEGISEEAAFEKLLRLLMKKDMKVQGQRRIFVAGIRDHKSVPSSFRFGNSGAVHD